MRSIESIWNDLWLLYTFDRGCFSFIFILYLLYAWKAALSQFHLHSSGERESMRMYELQRSRLIYGNETKGSLLKLRAMRVSHDHFLAKTSSLYQTWLYMLHYVLSVSVFISAQHVHRMGIQVCLHVQLPCEFQVGRRLLCWLTCVAGTFVAPVSLSHRSAHHWLSDGRA